MTIYFSPSMDVCYDTDINGSNIPADKIEITKAQQVSITECLCNGGSIVVDDNGVPQPVAAQAPTLAQVQAELCVQIDASADVAYEAIGGPSPGRLAEYKQAKADADAFKAAGYAGTVPDTVACWAEAKGWTDQAACDDILSTATSWESALAAIRRQRLIGKANVTASADEASAQSAANAAITNIQAVPTGAA